MDRADGAENLCLGLLRQWPVDKCERLIMVAWQIWNHRNGVVWRAETLSPAVAVYRAKNYLEDWKVVHTLQSSSLPNNECNRWHAPG